MAEFLTELKRTHTCGELRAEHVGEDVVLMGWVQSNRDHGGSIFIDLRDRYGITQIRFDASMDAGVHATADRLRSEWVVAVRGKVISRGDNANPNLATGTIEVLGEQLAVFSEAQTPPFQIQDSIDTNENLRLEYRFLDLRRGTLQRNLVLRSRVNRIMRNYLGDMRFVELETPILTKSTPEGARDYLVPSRVYPGQFFALPQSPQLFKQLFMVAGMDRYFQICRCFRDEDLRADRQPEFTQLDIEMSFVAPDDIFAMCDGLVARIFKEILDHEVTLPLPRITYAEAMDKYGVDNPDVRFELHLTDLTDIAADCDFKVFRSTAESGGLVKAINIKGKADLSRKQLSDLEAIAKTYGAKGMAWIKIHQDDWQSPIAKFLSDPIRARMTERLDLEEGDVVVFVADTAKVTNDALGNLRKHLGRELGLYDPKTFAFTWVTRFPMFEHDPAEGRYYAVHHPFTSPLAEDLHLLDSDPAAAKAAAYDLVLNGNEIAGGSIRIHNRDVQEKVFRLLGIGEEEAQTKFGFLLKAFSYGAPPHGGIAFGLDRVMMLLTGAESIRDVIAYPKTQKSSCLMTQAPSLVAQDQLDELGLRIAPQAS